LQTIFGPVLCFLQEGENPAELLRFQVTRGALGSQSKQLAGEN
jgi:hypothetical protein